jgi:hypothetical protein
MVYRGSTASDGELREEKALALDVTNSIREMW